MGRVGVKALGRAKGTVFLIMGKTAISYANMNWDVLAGCAKVSDGCESCWAARLAATRLKHNPDYAGLARVTEGGRCQWTGEVRLLYRHLEEPLHWRAPRTVFVAPKGDLFHEAVPDGFIGDVFTVMALAPQHSFLCLTKRPERMQRIFSGTWLRPFMAAGQYPFLTRPYPGSVYALTDKWPLPNVILGVTVEDREHLPRLDILRQTPAARRWASFEPLLQDLGPVNLEGISWVVVGCESGPGARHMQLDWVRSLVQQCNTAKVPIFFKQSMEGAKINHMPSIDGRTWRQTPWGLSQKL